MTEPIHDTHTSTTGAARRAMAPATGRLALSDDRLLDELRRNARVSTRRIRADFVEVHTPTRVLGYVKGQRKSFVALRGDDPAWADEIGRYPSESLAVEALRMRRA
ncbi:hypothetical protein [Curtobacterium sp. MCBD17_019]|uniref:hypothetical protein n=1 Tax=Curtobacterium sp. MCBD17_019 TaxID=2175669 RepID=UPI000DA89451|nr:hypothetical protein [Curtobacterium sp. MCBD17_019]PZE76080.1 hypothetical protein DEI82_06145 [Curtobacterium sp. MCBD17_019]